MSWDEFESDARANVYPGPSCGVRRLLDALGEQARDAVQHGLDNVRLTSSGLHKALSERVDPGDLPSTQTITRHRRGACSCEREVS